MSTKNTEKSSDGSKVKTPQHVIFAKEYWTGDSRDGAIVNGDGYHYYRMSPEGLIIEAYEFYETDDGVEVAAPLPEMQNVDWKTDLGFEDLEALDIIEEVEFDRIRNLTLDKVKS
jgi:hypothetical protein